MAGPCDLLESSSSPDTYIAIRGSQSYANPPGSFAVFVVVKPVFRADWRTPNLLHKMMSLLAFLLPTRDHPSLAEVECLLEKEGGHDA